ncbi:MAG: hypothetical protein RMJ56_03490 [Gemmataceae bacterium]|nr:hypothetical protein [Gemmata sp.]MDW8196652.1 hypothetical protein [Gemmataceae bacterium]
MTPSLPDREFRLGTGFPITIIVGTAILVFVLLLTDGFYPLFAKDSSTLALAITWALYIAGGIPAVLAVWTLLDRRPRLITDRYGLIDFRQPGGPLELFWDDICTIALDLRGGLGNAELVITARNGDDFFVYLIGVANLDAAPGVVFDHVLRCHSLMAPVAEEVDESVAPLPEPARPWSPSEGEQTFSGRKVFRPDLRIVGGVLAASGIIGFCIMYIIGDDLLRPIDKSVSGVFWFASIVASFVGGMLVTTNVEVWGFGPLPPHGYPILTVSRSRITLTKTPEDDPLEIPWSRVRKVVYLNLEQPRRTLVYGVLIYYLTADDQVEQLCISLESWADPNGVLQALRTISSHATDPELLKTATEIEPDADHGDDRNGYDGQNRRGSYR